MASPTTNSLGGKQQCYVNNISTRGSCVRVDLNNYNPSVLIIHTNPAHTHVAGINTTMNRHHVVQVQQIIL